MDCQVLVLVAETFEQLADNEFETKTESSVLGMQHIVYRDTRQYHVLRVFMVDTCSMRSPWRRRNEGFWKTDEILLSDLLYNSRRTV